MWCVKNQNKTKQQTTRGEEEETKGKQHGWGREGEAWLVGKQPRLPHLSAANDAETRACTSLKLGLSQGIEQAWARLAGLLRRCALASVTCRRSCLGSDSWSLGAAAPYSSQHPFPQPGQGARAGIATASVAGRHGCHCLYPLRTGLSLPSVVGEGKQCERRKRAAQFRTVSICFPNSKGLLRIH